jgi:hypothetical protein
MSHYSDIPYDPGSSYYVHNIAGLVSRMFCGAGGESDRITKRALHSTAGQTSLSAPPENGRYQQLSSQVLAFHPTNCKGMYVRDQVLAPGLAHPTATARAAEFIRRFIRRQPMVRP